MWFDAGKRKLVLLRVAALLMLAGCGRSDSSSSSDPPPPAESGANATVAAGTPSPAPHREQDPARGRLLYMGSCSACHGQRGQGMPHQGVNLRASPFIARRSDDDLVTFLKRGRAPGEPDSVQGLLMPPRGGNPALDDAALRAIVGFLRRLQQDANADAPPVAQVTRE